MAVPFRLLELDEVDLDKIKQELNAVVDIYLGKAGAASEVDTLRIKKGDAVADLESAAKYATYTAGYEPASKDFVFEYTPAPEADGKAKPPIEVRIRVSTINGAVWFKSAASEEIIDYVWSIVRKVKGLA